ncbi:MarR family winged helix-turn-helix transcriptional regulator [Alteribacillus sp. YIM 98480]|uniref:MarR family winged helix-turn-helix transcriptional regulator n=1 Tax=Alteribacillus sp. YIM 98480 TaxID=2606599 RepID=UPI00131E23F0|nr:MarR family transcriptional regulator [Alteribacillus sp. YIM 98480]
MTDQTQVAGIEKSLRHVSYIVKQKGREILNKFPITPPQFVALQWLQEDGDMTIGELSNKLYLACSTTTDLVDRMEKNELVERIKDEKDRRVVQIHLLEKGESIIREVVKERQNYLEKVLNSFSEAEIKTIEQSMMVLHNKMTKEEQNI